jgi:hypothetical protein
LLARLAIFYLLVTQTSVPVIFIYFRQRPSQIFWFSV